MFLPCRKSYCDVSGSGSRRGRVNALQSKVFIRPMDHGRSQNSRVLGNYRDSRAIAVHGVEMAKNEPRPTRKFNSFHLFLIRCGLLNARARHAYWNGFR